jgi:hypothetical protein
MKKLALLVMFLMPVLPLAAQAPDDEDKGTGRVYGNYNVMQSIEVGDRITGTYGNQQVYQTFVNLSNGPRLLGQDLTMRSLNHEGTLFDNLYVSSFGFGGDPNQVARVRAEKNKWYNFVGLYRRDINFFDYDLFANPLTLNPGIVNCSTASSSVACTNAFNPRSNFFYANSPHLQDTTRNMGDFFLTLLPQSMVHFRLGFARNDNKGTVDSSLEDVNIPLTQQSHTRSDRWTFGVDVLPAPRTSLSFTEYYQHDKLDIDYVNNPVNNLPLGSATGPQVTLPLYFPPCTISAAGPTPPKGTPLPAIPSPGILSSLCNTGVFNYARNENVRSGFPTSELTFHSTYFRKLDITGGGTYTDGQSKVLNYNDLFYGLVSRTGETAYLVTGEPKTSRVSASADLGLTYHISKQWSVSDKFRWLDWRDPGVFTQTTLDCYANLAASSATLSTPTGNPCGIPGIATSGNVLGLSSSALATSTTAYNQIVNYNVLEAERTYYNTAQVKWDPSRRFSAYLGYRYGRRELKTSYLAGTTSFDVGAINTPVAGVPVFAPLTTDKINENTALLGTVIRPTVNWRINADTELLSADNAFNNITPRHQQRVRARTVYKVKRWASVNGGINLVESRNGWAENFGGPGVNLFPTSVAPAYGTKSHSRYYSVGTTLNPDGRLSVEFGYTYLDQKFDTAACMLLANTAFGAGSTPAACPTTTNQPTVPATFNIAAQTGDVNVPVTQAYQENTHTGYVNIFIRPVRRVTVILGYEITSTTGSDNWLSAATGLPLVVYGDIYGNVPGIAGNPGTSVVTISGTPTAVGTIPFAGPFPDQPLGPQVFNWQRPSAAVAYEVRKNLTFKGAYAFYDYNEKEGNLSLNQIVTLPRNFHANVGTVSMRYSF